MGYKRFVTNTVTILSQSVASSISNISSGGGGGTITIPLYQGVSSQYLHHSYQYIGKNAVINEVKFVRAGTQQNSSGNAFTASFGGFGVSYFDNNLQELVATNDPIYVYVKKNSYTGSSVLHTTLYDITNKPFNVLNNVPLSTTSSNLNISSTDALFIGVECPAVFTNPSLQVSVYSDTAYLIIRYTVS